MRKTTIALGLAGALLLGGSAGAHNADLISRARAGAIRINKTTVKQAKAWLGDPSRTVRTKIGCDVPVTKLFWGDDAKAFFWEVDGKRRASEVWIKQRTIALPSGDDLTIHTKRNLRVGDSLKKLKNKYPNTTFYRVPGQGRFYDLHPATKSADARIEAIVRNKEVVALRNAPYEYC
jgi:hypothetical protein